MWFSAPLFLLPDISAPILPLGQSGEAYPLGLSWETGDSLIPIWGISGETCWQDRQSHLNIESSYMARCYHATVSCHVMDVAIVSIEADVDISRVGFTSEMSRYVKRFFSMDPLHVNSGKQ
jgi:hypothetical protein